MAFKIVAGFGKQAGAPYVRCLSGHTCERISLHATASTHYANKSSELRSGQIAAERSARVSEFVFTCLASL